MNTPAAAARRVAATACLLGLAAFAAACGTATNPSCSPSTSPSASPASTRAAPAPSASASPTPAGTATAGHATACPTSALKAVVDTHQAGAAAGSVYYPIDFTNVSASACTLYGFPGVSFVTGPGGSQIGSPASRNTTLAPVTVTLAPGAVAHSTIQVAQAGNYDAAQCKPVTAHWLKVYPPDQTAALHIGFSTQVCSAVLPTSIGPQTSVYAVRSGPGRNGQL